MHDIYWSHRSHADISTYIHYISKPCIALLLFTSQKQTHTHTMAEIFGFELNYPDQSVTMFNVDREFLHFLVELSLGSRGLISTMSVLLNLQSDLTTVTVCVGQGIHLHTLLEEMGLPVL